MKNLQRHIVAEEPHIDMASEICDRGVSRIKGCYEMAWACIELTKKEEEKFLLDDEQDKYGEIMIDNLYEGHKSYRKIVQGEYGEGFAYFLHGMEKYKSKECAQAILDEVAETKRDFIDECVSNMDEIIEKAESMVGKQKEE